MSSVAPSPRARLAYLDWLRFIVVLLLTPFHAGISFTGVGSVYVYDAPVRDILLAGGTPNNVGPLVFTLLTVFLDNWFMHLLFFVSGIGAALSLRKRNAGQFMAERSNRLGLMLTLGTVFVVSIQSWLRAVAFGKFSGGFFAFFPKFFNGFFTGPLSSGNFDCGHFWFLGYLFVFSALALPLFLYIRRKGESSRLLSAARRFAGMPLILLPALWLVFLEVAFRPGWPGNFSLINDWAVVSVNLSFFIGGFIAMSVPELLPAVEKHRRTLLILGMCAFLTRMTIYQFFPVPGGYNAANIVVSALRGLAAYGLVTAAIGYGQRYLNHTGKWLGIARDLSLPLYVLHYAPLTAATYLLLNSGLSIGVRWILSVAASWGFVVLFTLAARYIPLLRDFFSIRKPAVKAI